MQSLLVKLFPTTSHSKLKAFVVSCDYTFMGLKKLVGNGLQKTAALAGDVASKTVTNLLSEIAAELIKETGVKDLAVSAIVDVGKKILKDDSIGAEKYKYDILKQLIKKELGI